VNAGEFKQMQQLLQPISYERANTKMEQYQSGSIQKNKKNLQGHGLAALDPLP